MELMENKEMITSRDLLKKINELREKEYEEKAKAGTLTESEIKRGKFIELRHDTLISIIKNEFSEEITGLKNYLSENLGVQNILETSQQKLLLLNEKIGKGKISSTSIIESEYIDQWNRKQLMYILGLPQAKQVLMRESKFVRKAVIEYIDYLENQNRQLEELARLQARELSKVTRNIETLNLKALLEYGKVRKEKQRIYYIHYSNLARNIAGIPKGIKRDELTQGQLGILQQVELIMAAVINECMAENIPFVLMYQEVKDRTEIKAKVLLKALQRIENVDNGPVWKIGY
ncbi:hypothetical protein JCM16776_0299 [Leptotrichia shahii]|uniref:Uncharacterized protein n=1 Tax=Leptotrichia shahii TaxID=157691 RepID=A0A510JLK8_9FUSO|nr:hypothetical protein [Leptotrichia shahii]BBM40086.1 hypothetical protein JCM16776_0299 [Leptotrichia shahii]